MTGLRFLVRVTLRRHDLAFEIYHIKEPQKVPLILDQARPSAGVKHKAAFAVAYGAGLRVSEFVHLKDLGHRQPTHAAAHRRGQGEEGPARDALPTAVSAVAGLLVGSEAKHSG
jgi:site-specific recombinase XerD